jgi:hypothetical protein
MVPNRTKHALNPVHQPECPRGQRQAVAADGGVLTGCVHGPQDGVAVALREAIAKFGNPQRIHSRAKKAQLVAVLRASFHPDSAEPYPDANVRRPVALKSLGSVPLERKQRKAPL